MENPKPSQMLGKTTGGSVGGDGDARQRLSVSSDCRNSGLRGIPTWQIKMILSAALSHLSNSCSSLLTPSFRAS